MRNTVAFIFIILLTSCLNKEGMLNEYELKKSDHKMTFHLDNETTQVIKALFRYVDKSGKEYLVFQNGKKPEILFYSMPDCKLMKKLVLLHT